MGVGVDGGVAVAEGEEEGAVELADAVLVILLVPDLALFGFGFYYGVADGGVSGHPVGWLAEFIAVLCGGR